MPYLPQLLGRLAAPTWIGLILSAVALVSCGILFLKLRRRSAPEEPDRGIPDVLGAILKRTRVPETDGVRWDVSIYPESLSVPGYIIVTAILQNAYDRPRTVTLEVAPGILVPQGLSCFVALNGGEAGIFRTPLFVSRNLAPGDYEIRATVRGSAPRGVGSRMLAAAPRHRGPRKASLRILSAHDQPPVNLFAYDWKGFTSLYNPPQTAPDVTEVWILQELPSSPSDSGRP